MLVRCAKRSGISELWLPYSIWGGVSSHRSAHRLYSSLWERNCLKLQRRIVVNRCQCLCIFRVYFRFIPSQLNDFSKSILIILTRFSLSRFKGRIWSRFWFLSFLSPSYVRVRLVCGSFFFHFLAILWMWATRQGISLVEWSEYTRSDNLLSHDHFQVIYLPLHRCWIDGGQSKTKA